jgi:outer membrane receptor protein involved in Fe transport
VFEERGPLSSVPVRGNPDLEPETNIAYQAALQHLFSKDVSGQFAVFFRDIFGLVTSRTERDAGGNLVPRYVNEDYASARGFEASVTKNFSHQFSAQMDYTYSFATGVASDPNSALAFFNGGRLYLPISEQPLLWDQRHTLNVQLLVRQPGRWGFHMGWEYGSGLPFTPLFRNDRRADPVLANSRRQPSRAVLNLDGDKYYKVWGVPLTFYFDARNVLDMKIIRSLSPGSINNPNVNQGGDDYTTYYTETGRAGGAYLQDTNGDGVLDWVPLRDPRVFEEGRQVRLGVNVSF